MNSTEIKSLLFNKINELDSSNILDKIDIDLKNNVIVLIKNNATAFLFYKSREIITHYINESIELDTFVKDKSKEIINFAWSIQ